MHDFEFQFGSDTPLTKSMVRRTETEHSNTEAPGDHRGTVTTSLLVALKFLPEELSCDLRRWSAALNVDSLTRSHTEILESKRMGMTR